MDGSGKCKLSSTPPSAGLSRIQHLNMVIVNCVHPVLKEKSMGGLNKMEF